jgi:hypothetical protein
MKLRFGLCLAAVALAGTLAAWQAGLFSTGTSDRPASDVPRREEPSAHTAPAAPAKPTPGLPWFEEVAKASGIDFLHFDSATPIHYIMETMGSGIAWIDYDNDGWPDLFCVQDGPLRPATGQGPPPTHKLYRNNGDGTFTDVTEKVGLARSGYGMGCAVGDYDNDGYDDLVVTYLGGITLFHNEPDGHGGRHFVDVTARAGIRDPHWATSCAWGDIDGDGRLDLYVCNYVVVDFDRYPFCGNEKTGVRASCPPTSFPNVSHQLYRNNGDGTFTDVSESSGISKVPPAPGLAVLMLDLDGDGKTDIYVANDLKPAYLFHNQGGGRFEEKGLLSGCSLGPLGVLIAGMGIAAGDIDGTGRPSLFVTNFQHKPNVLFRNKGNLFFQEWSNASGLGPPSLDRLAFGTVFLDADLDGKLDVAVANGHIDRNACELVGDAFPQEAQLFRGLGGGRFQDVSATSGEYFRTPGIGRGLALADYDNDGRPDLAYSHNAGRVALLHNRTETSNNWICLELIGDGKRSNRNAIGARAEVEAGGARQVHWIPGGGSYLSASERRLLIGLGKADRAERISITWPSGRTQTFRDVAGKRWVRLREGIDQPEPVTPVRPAARPKS